MGKTFITLLLGISGLSNVAAQGYAAGTTALERSQLPKYCWPQYIDAKYGGQPGYSIPRYSCGESMNHLCPGLIELIRAEKVSDPRNARTTNAGKAIANFNYTLSNMLPACPLRAEVQGYLARAKLIAPKAK
jgi:hypothetical protein